MAFLPESLCTASAVGREQDTIYLLLPIFSIDHSPGAPGCCKKKVGGSVFHIHTDFSFRFVEFCRVLRPLHSQRSSENSVRAVNVFPTAPWSCCNHWHDARHEALNAAFSCWAEWTIRCTSQRLLQFGSEHMLKNENQWLRRRERHMQRCENRPLEIYF